MKYLRIHINFYHNRIINECARKVKVKIPESQFQSFTVFFVRCRRTYVLKNTPIFHKKDTTIDFRVKEDNQEGRGGGAEIHYNIMVYYDADRFNV